MKENYEIKLRCATCGCDDQFEYNDDKSYIKCSFCNREYWGGIEELQDLNEELIDELKEEIQTDARNYLESKLKEAFKESKYIKFK